MPYTTPSTKRHEGCEPPRHIWGTSGPLRFSYAPRDLRDNNGPQAALDTWWAFMAKRIV